jgi:hypothetical protein
MKIPDKIKEIEKHYEYGNDLLHIKDVRKIYTFRSGKCLSITKKENNTGWARKCLADGWLGLTTD